jgi:hypothetical protein
MQLTPLKFKILAYLNHVSNLKTSNLVLNPSLVPCTHYTFPSMLSNVYEYNHNLKSHIS